MSTATTNSLAVQPDFLNPSERLQPCKSDGIQGSAAKLTT